MASSCPTVADERAAGVVTELQSGVLFSPADAMLSLAIGTPLAAASGERVAIFERLTAEIANHIAANFPQRPWACTLFTGTDGSRIFRGGVGHSLVIDAAGRLWRARGYEDFETTWNLQHGTCDIATLTPIYGQMREYVVRAQS